MGLPPRQVSCALPATAIGSHLDTDTNLNTCRLAFHGKLVRALTTDDLKTLRVFKHKSKEGQVDRVQDDQTVICKNLFKPGTDMNMFIGMTVQLGDDGPVGRIDSTFGKTKFKCIFPDLEPGALAKACTGARLRLRYKRFVFDEKKKMVQ